MDVGIGSPTGLKFGTDSSFPEKYKKALFALDWSYGRIFAVHLTPKGASYEATFETFLKGKTLSTELGEQAMSVALANAAPLKYNATKIDMAKGLLASGLARLNT